MRKRFIKNLSKGISSESAAQSLIGTLSADTRRPTVGLTRGRSSRSAAHQDWGDPHILSSISPRGGDSAAVSYRQGKDRRKENAREPGPRVKSITQTVLSFPTENNVCANRYTTCTASSSGKPGSQGDGLVDYLVDARRTPTSAGIFSICCPVWASILMLRPMDISLEDIFLRSQPKTRRFPECLPSGKRKCRLLLSRSHMYSRVFAGFRLSSRCPIYLAIMHPFRDTSKP